MSALDNLSWTFPVTEMSQYMGDHLVMIMPLVITILGVLLALLVVEGFTDVLLKVGLFIVGDRSYSRGIGSTEFDIEMDILIGGGKRSKRSSRGLGDGLDFDLSAEDYDEVDDD